MLIVLIGPDAYSRQERAGIIRAEYLKKHRAISLELFDVECEGEIGRLEEFAHSAGLFGSSRLAVVKNIGLTSEVSRLKKLFVKYATDPGLTALISEPSLKKEFSFLRELKKPNVVEKYEILTEGAFLSFIKKEASKRNLVLEADALKYLGRVFAGDMWRAVTELEKLSLLTQKISPGLFGKLGIKVGENFFAHVRWAGKDVAGRLCHLENLLSMKEDEAKIFNIMAYQNNGRLKEFADLDVEIKSGRLEYGEALLSLALSTGR